MSLSLQTDIVTTAGTVEAPAQLHALLHTCGIAPLNHLGWIRVTGEDRVRWLNGMVTNSINDLHPGDGCFNFILNAQGRIQGTAYAFAQPDSILLQTSRDQLSALLTTLDRFIIMDDVELTDITETQADLQAAITLIGPEAPAILTRIGLDAPSSGPLSLHKATWESAEVTLIAAYSPLVPRFELWADSATVTSLLAALTRAGAVLSAPEPIEWLRILEGTPRYGTDIRDKELPQETSQTQALHFNKGCYLGQEIVERIRSRGAVHRTFTAFRLEGTLPSLGAPIESEGKPVGELTSIAAIPFASGTLQIGLGYIRREALELASRASSLTSAGTPVIPISLPIREP